MKKILWVIPGLALSTSLLAQQLTNPAPATTIESPAPAAVEPTPAAVATNAAPKSAEKAAPKKSAKKAAVKAAKKVQYAPHTTALVPGTATVVASNVNVRGQAKLRSEVVARITKGQEVTVLEEIVRNNSADDEPSAWAKILLPTNATVWVHMNFLSNNVVVPNQLNVRGGPGENYSVLGRIPRGTAVTLVSTKDVWMQIPAPADAYAFVASQYLKQETTPLIASAAPGAQPAVAETPAKETATAPMETPAAPESVAEAPAVAPAPADVPTPPAPPVAVETPATVAAPTTIAATDTNAAPEETIEEPPPKRVVQREGIVRGTGSIQAPTHFALVSPTTGKLINYLYSSSPSLDLRRYKGFRIMVAGEEAIEERWGNTPVITIQKLEVLDE